MFKMFLGASNFLLNSFLFESRMIPTVWKIVMLLRVVFNADSASIPFESHSIDSSRLTTMIGPFHVACTLGDLVMEWPIYFPGSVRPERVGMHGFASNPTHATGAFLSLSLNAETFQAISRRWWLLTTSSDPSHREWSSRKISDWSVLPELLSDSDELWRCVINTLGQFINIIWMQAIGFSQILKGDSSYVN